jgi:7-cyano-7-deazaguanine synthase in queuosine biosynthesis
VVHRPALGWARHFRIRIPVHSPDSFRESSVSQALLDALSFLTGDEWELEFVQRKVPAEQPEQGRITLPEGLEAVIPFSDGLDSLAVGALAALELGDGLIRVRIGTGSWDRRTLAKRRVPFTSIPYKVQTRGPEFAESSARSRGFKFVLVSGLAAYLAKAQRVIMTESGQGALGPAIVTVGQSYADYRNHPLFTEKMERFIQALVGHVVRFEFPRLWSTKAETLRLYSDKCVDGGALFSTRSCWQSSRQVGVAGKRRQCGVCAACLLRRMSVHAAGLSEPADNYVWENLSAKTFSEGAHSGFALKRISTSFREYAIAGTLHLDHLATVRRSAVNSYPLSLAAHQLARSLNSTKADVEGRLNGLLDRHTGEWNAFRHSLGNKSFLSEWTENSQL